MESNAKMPEVLVLHEKDYKPNAWKTYTIEELSLLGIFVSLLVKRAAHRANREKCQKDLYDAKNYAAMLVAKVEAVEKSLLFGE